MITKVDATIMKDMASISLRARNEIEAAANILNSVTTHNDWNCVERDWINESICDVKRFNETVSRNIESYSSSISQQANRFSEYENELLARFAQFDASLGELHRIKDTRVRSAVSSTINTSDISQKVNKNDSNYWNQYHANNMDKSISVMSFEEAIQILGHAKE